MAQNKELKACHPSPPSPYAPSSRLVISLLTSDISLLFLKFVFYCIQLN